MTYRIEGLKRADFDALFALDEAELAARNARRVTASGPGFPCRITLEDAAAGETLILLNHISHDVATPYRASYAIYVRESAGPSARFVDETPPGFANRPIALRAFDAQGMLRTAALALPGEADAQIRTLFADPAIAYIHAHNAAHGCFSARIERG